MAGTGDARSFEDTARKGERQGGLLSQQVCFPLRRDPAGGVAGVFGPRSLPGLERRRRMSLTSHGVAYGSDRSHDVCLDVRPHRLLVRRSADQNKRPGLSVSDIGQSRFPSLQRCLFRSCQASTTRGGRGPWFRMCSSSACCSHRCCLSRTRPTPTSTGVGRCQRIIPWRCTRSRRTCLSQRRRQLFVSTAVQRPQSMMGGGWVMLGLGLAGRADVTCCCFLLLLFVLTWLAPQTKNEEAFDWLGRRDQLQLALWGSVILVSLYLVLTWVLLLASIDAVNFEAHELYGAPFLAALGAASFLYTRRNDDPQSTMMLLGATVLVSIVGMVFAPDAFGRDSSTAVSQHLTRGHIVWISLPMLTLALAPMVREVTVNITGLQAFKRIRWVHTLFTWVCFCCSWGTCRRPCWSTEEQLNIGFRW